MGAVQGIRDFPYLKLGIRDFKVKQERDSGLKVCTGGVMSKITLGITGLHEIMGRDYKTEEPHCGTSVPLRQRLLIFRYPAVTTKKNIPCSRC